MFENWPILREPISGPELINIDFELMKLSSVTLTDDLWCEFFNKIYDIKLTPTKAVTLVPLIDLIELPDLDPGYYFYYL